MGYSWGLGYAQYWIVLTVPCVAMAGDWVTHILDHAAGLMCGFCGELRLDQGLRPNRDGEMKQFIKQVFGVDRKRDSAIELLRIVACIFVIRIHMSLGNYFNDQLSRRALFLSCLGADGVAMFWFMTGAFLFRAKRYGKVLKSTANKIVLPMLLILFTVRLLEGWLFGGVSLMESLKAYSLSTLVSDLKIILLEWRSPVDHTGQLWYLFAYIFIMLLFPFAAAFVRQMDREAWLLCCFIIGSVGLFLLNDISLNRLAEFSHHSFGAAIPGLIIMIWGHLIYARKDVLAEKVPVWCFLAGFFLLNLARCLIQAYVFEHVDPAANSILYWYSSFGLAATICLFLFFNGIRSVINGGGLHVLINSIASFTFSIYLLHEILIVLAAKRGWLAAIQSRIGVDASLHRQLLYYILGVGLVFAACLVLALLIRCAWLGIKQGGSLLWKKGNS